MRLSGSILLDSSALIEYYRPQGDPEVQRQVAKVIKAHLVVTNGIVQTELLAFTKTEKAFEALHRDFEAFFWVDLTLIDFKRAAEMGYQLRRQGITVPVTDLVIAASAMQTNATLYHLDAHFDSIQEHCGLKARNLRFTPPDEESSPPRSPGVAG